MATVLIAPPPAVEAAPVKPAETPGGSAAARDEASASSRAAATGQRVEVEGLRDEHSQTFARPDGSFVTETSLRPERVRRTDGTWAAVDTTLRRAADGSVAPIASTVDVRFSGGGTAPFAVLRDGDEKVALRWPEALPEPVLDGDTATYRDVLPGVDLQVRADVDSFTHVVVIRSAKAARNPALSRITLGTELSGLSLRTEPGTGVVSAVDGAGAVRFEGPTPSMWDSRDVQPASQPRSAGETSAAGPPPQPREGMVTAEVSAGQLTLVPDARMLADPATVFPVYVDPTWTKKTAAKTAWTVLRQTWPTRSYYKASTITSSDGNYGVIRTGYSDWESPTVRDRSLFAFDITPFKYKHIYKATFSLTQQWSGAACTYTGTRRTELRWLNTGFNSSTTWNTGWNSSGSGWKEVLATSDAVRRYGYSCGPKKAEFNVTGKVAQLAASGAGTLNLGLRAKSESDRYQWKRFQSDGGLSIEYNTKPNAARDLGVAGKACASGAGRPFITGNAPTFTARSSDPDVGQQSLTTRFFYWKSGQARNNGIYVQGTSANPAPVISGPISTTDAAKQLANDTVYVYQAFTFDNVNDGTWTGMCEFHTDFTPPNAASDIASTDNAYPEYNPANPNQPGSGGVGFNGAMRVYPPANVPGDVVYYRWSLDNVQPAVAARVTADASKNGYITVRPRRDGLNTLRVWSEDRAGLFSGVVNYQFKVASGSGPAAEWTFDEASGSASDVTDHGNTAALGGSAGRTAGRSGVGTALSVNGTTGYAATAGTVTQPHPTTDVSTPVSPTGSFTATAWVRLAATGGAVRSVVSYDGANLHAMRLAYNGADNKWIFRTVPTDTAGAAGATITSTSSGVVGKWTHLAMVWDPLTPQMRLYVNGVLEASYTAGSNWSPHGNGSLFSIGRSRVSTGTFGEFFSGAIDDARVYSFILSVDAIKALAEPLKPQVSFATSAVNVGQPAQVTFNAGGDTNVTKFKYSVGTDSLNLTATPSTPGGAATVSIPTSQVGQLTVWAAGWHEAVNLTSESVSASIEVRGTAAISGRIFDAVTQQLRPGAAVVLEPNGLTTTSDANGIYSFTALTPGDYTVAATYGGGCGLAGSTQLTIASAAEVNLYLEPVMDSYGYGCQVVDDAFVPANGSVLPLSGDNAVTAVSLPFAFPFYGQTYTSAWVDTNGFLSLVDPAGSHPGNGATIPSAGAPNAVVAAFWDDLVVDASASVRTATVGSAPLRQFIVEWRNVHRTGDTTQRITVSASLGEDGFIVVNYAGLDTDPEKGESAAVGIESPGGEVGLQYSYHAPVLANGQAVAFIPPVVANPIQIVELSGTVTDAASGAAQAGAVVTLEESGRTVTADASGAYTFTGVESGTYTVSALNGQHCGKVLSLEVDLYETADVDLPLRPLADAYGNTCQAGPVTYVPANDTVLALTGDEVAERITAPFPISFYGQSYTTIFVEANGLLTFAPHTGRSWDVTELPSTDEEGMPNAAVYAFWGDWVVDSAASVRTATTGSAPNRQFIVEWRNIHDAADPTIRASFEVIFHETGDIVVTWKDIDPGDREQGSGGAVAIENADGTVALVHAFREAVIANGQGVRFTPGSAPIGRITGTVTCAGAPAGGVSVKAAGKSTTTAADGDYEIADVPGGPYTVLATPGVGSGCYGTAAEPAYVSVSQAAVANLDLAGSSGTRYTVTEQARTFVPANGTVLPLTGDFGAQELSLPFPVRLYGQSYTTAWVANDGLVTFEEIVSPTWDIGPLPDQAAHRTDNAVYPFWHDWVLDGSSSVRTATTGTAPNRQYIIEWRDVVSYPDPTARATFEVIFHESGDIEIVWDDIDPNFYEQGGDATVGVENADGTVAIQYLYRHPVIVDGRGLLLHPVTS